jgi:hypothetical protein
MEAERCVLERSSTISIWLDVPSTTPLLVRADGGVVSATGREVQGGVLLAFVVPEKAATVVVESPVERWSPPVTVAIELRPSVVDPAATVEELESLVATTEGWDRLRVLDAIRMASRGKPRAFTAARAELELARELGASKHQVLLLGQRVYGQIEGQHDFRAARTSLDALAKLAEESLFAKSRWEYYNALLARRSGDFGTALTGFEDSLALGERLDYGVPQAAELLANTLAELGRVDEALPLFRSLERRLWNGEGSCAEWTRIANNLAWGQLVIGAAGHEHDDPRPMLLSALERFEECPHAWRHAAVLLDLALAELEYGHPLDARGWLARMETVPADLQGWVDVTSLSAALAGGDVRSQPPLLLGPAPTSDVELAWNQQVLRGDQLAAWGFFGAAAQSYARAEEGLSQTFEHVGASKGGELYVAGRASSLRGLVDVLVELEQPSRAACAIRLARAREFARLDRFARLGVATQAERATWERELIEIAERQRETTKVRSTLWELDDGERSRATVRLAEREREDQKRLDAALRGLGLEPRPRACSDLRRPEEGEVLLIVMGAYVFAQDQHGVEVAERATLSSLGALEHASRITVLEAATEDGDPLHLAAWREHETLIDVAPVSYSLDLPPRTPDRSRKRHALLLADPRNDLPQARLEADAVRGALEGRGWSVTDLRGARATRATILEEAAQASLMHYAGHGIRSGVSGWDSALLLANDERLDVHDIFALPGVPNGVVLTGCETGASTPETVGGGMNVARALVLAGSEWVIGADAEVPDAVARRVGEAIAAEAGADGPARLRAALRRVRADDPDLPWQHFRAITP